MVDRSGLKALPQATQQLILQLNELFVEFVGPIGWDLSNDIFMRCAPEAKFGPAAIRRYVNELSDQLENVADKRTFLQRAEKLLLQ